MKQKEVNIPLLYAYIYRNIKEGCDERVVEKKKAIVLMRKVVHTAPRVIYAKIFEELEQMNLINIVNRDNIIIKNSKVCEIQLKKLKEYIFPLSP
jgi:hypothetical protein